MATDTSTLELHNKLNVLDPAAAASIDHRNVRRTIRALEVILQTGERFSKQRNSVESAYNCIFIGLIRPRAELYQRVDQRIENMFEAGLLAEVEGLLRNGYSNDLPSMSAIGYREAILVLNGSISLPEAKSEMKRITRVFIRRQSNWFKADDPNIQWFNPSTDSVETIRETILRGLK
jgi:tRNA dimethylallyltransferase